MNMASLAGQLLQYIVTGVTIGSIYAMVAIGFNIIYNVTEIINLAQGEFVMLGGLVMVSLHMLWKLPLIAAFPVTVVIVTGIGLLMNYAAIRPIRRPTVLTLIIATIAASMIIKGAAMLIWGTDSFDLTAFSGRTPILIAGAAIQPQYFWVIGFLVVIVAGLTFFFDKTIIGKAMSACSENAAAAQLVGIDVRWMVLLSFALSAAIGAIAGITMTPIALMDYDRGAMLAIKGFGAAVLGGLGSFPGAIVGGLMMGLIESLGAGFLWSGYKDAYALAALLIVLFIRPSGIMGNRDVIRFKRF